MRYVVGFLITIGLIILLFVLLLRGGGGKPVPTTGVKLESYANTATVVRLTIDGPINAAETHRAVQITVGRDQASIDIIQGYDHHVLQSSSYNNTEASYDVFLHALDHAGFTNGNNDASLKDERGYCPQGRRYIFEIIQDGKNLERYWATSCRGSTTFKGALNINLQLFKSQIPNYDRLTVGLSV